ncbi:hypothetical protein [uncultured Shewanella sp.]|uniref:hypothetical protein n=1 Tax=uncultured Shewanella sp. TaxID=173975 RepID=UPI00260F2C0B|nr:hypothetical protein [uncultured Shewanella sp.]
MVNIKLTFKIKLILVGVLVLSLFYLTVLYLSFRPNVSPAYAEYYIHNRTMFYRQSTPNILIPMDKLLTVKMLEPYFSRDGWSKKLIKSGTALFSGKASLLFNLEDKSQVKTFKFIFYPPKSTVDVFFTIAGHTFEKQLISEDESAVSLNVPNTLLDDKSDVVNTLTMSSSVPISLKSLMVKGSQNEPKFNAYCTCL